MVNLILTCGRYLRTELFRNKKASKILQRNSSQKIKIPPRVHRGPLDVLQALADTVKNEAGVVDYKLQHGGLFEHNSHHFRRIVSLAMDSGRKAAKWVVSENPKFFQHKYADPYIKAFAPPKIIDENTEVSEAMLLESIEDVNVEDAIKLYKMLREKNIDVSEETKQILLEMVSYFNGKNKPDETAIETKHYENPKTVVLNTWDKDGFAEELFLEMEPSVLTYTTMILGRMKYNNITNALKLYEEGKEKGFQFGVDVYNVLLENVCKKVFEHTEQEAYIIELLKEMKDKNIKPNLGTLNSVLVSVSAMKKWTKARSLAVKVYQEFIGIGIEPSLATYYHLIDIFSDRNRVTPAFEEILEQVSNKFFLPQHPNDFKFFILAMEVATYTFKSIALTHLVHEILMKGSNRCFLVGNINLTKYYRMYLASNFRYGDLEDAIHLFEKCVPQVYVPEAAGVLMFLSSLNEKDGSHLLPKMWPLIQDISLKSDKIFSLVLSIIPKGISRDNANEFLPIAKELWEVYTKKINFNSIAEDLSSFLKIFVLGGDQNSSNLVFNKAVSLGMEDIELDFESLKLYNDFCISNGDKKNALLSLQFAVMAKHKRADMLAEQVKSKLTLKNIEEEFLQKLMEKHEKFQQLKMEKNKSDTISDTV